METRVSLGSLGQLGNLLYLAFFLGEVTPIFKGLDCQLGHPRLKHLLF